MTKEVLFHASEAFVTRLSSSYTKYTHSIHGPPSHVHSVMYSIHGHSILYTIHVYRIMYCMYVHIILYSIYVHCILCSIHVYNLLCSTHVHSILYSVNVHSILAAFMCICCLKLSYELIKYDSGN